MSAIKQLYLECQNYDFYFNGEYTLAINVNNGKGCKISDLEEQKFLLNLPLAGNVFPVGDYELFLDWWNNYLPVDDITLVEWTISEHFQPAARVYCKNSRVISVPFCLALSAASWGHLFRNCKFINVEEFVPFDEDEL